MKRKQDHAPLSLHTSLLQRASVARKKTLSLFARKLLMLPAALLLRAAARRSGGCGAAAAGGGARGLTSSAPAASAAAADAAPAPEMIEVTVNGAPVSIPKGANVMAACTAASVDIPR